MIKDNSAYLIKQIVQATQKKIDELKAEHKKDLASLRKKHDRSAELKQLKLSLEKQRQDFVRQQENMLDLQQDHAHLKAVAALVHQVTEELRKELFKPSMIKLIIASLGKVESVEVPKSVKMEGAVRDDAKIVGITKSGTEIEFDIDEFLEEQKGLIYSRIREEV